MYTSALRLMLHGREVTVLAPKALKHEIGALLADGLAFQKEGFSSRWPPIGAGR
jgi:hypothetical protein